MESVQLEHKNVTKLVLVILWDGVEEGRKFERVKGSNDFKRVFICAIHFIYIYIELIAFNR